MPRTAGVNEFNQGNAAQCEENQAKQPVAAAVIYFLPTPRENRMLCLPPWFFHVGPEMKSC